MSLEHVWPQWLTSGLPLPAPIPRSERVPAQVVRIELDKSWAEERGYPPSQKDTKVKVVCKPCNNNWMSQLEQHAAPSIRTLISGAGMKLRPPAAAVLERWAIKTAMMFEYTHPHSVVATREMYGAVKDGRPVPGAVVMVARRSRGEILDFSHLGIAMHTDSGEFPDPSKAPHTYGKTTLAMGPLVFVVFFASGKEPLKTALLKSIRPIYGDVLSPIGRLERRRWPRRGMSQSAYEDVKGGVYLPS